MTISGNALTYPYVSDFPLQLFQCFQTLGICKGAKGAKNCVDRLVKEFDREIISWKKVSH